MILLSTALAADGDVVVRAQDRAVRGSRWGFVGDFQRALTAERAKCGLPAVPDDGVFGAGTREAVVELGECPGYTGLDGVVTEGLWTRVVGTPAPSARERAVAMTLTFEGTDFDRMEWNYPVPGDERSALTWGPFGATAGWGGEVQTVLRTVDRADPQAIGASFGDEAGAVHRLMGTPGASAFELLLPVYQDPVRRARWRDGFTALGASGAARAAYVDAAFDPAWLGTAMGRLRDLLPGPPTEVDAAFFLDLAVQVSVTPARTDAARRAILAAEAQEPLTAARRRQVIGQAFADALGRWAENRRGRNACYYLDGAPLGAAEAAAWTTWGRMRASDLGLSDERLAGW